LASPAAFSAAAAAALDPKTVTPPVSFLPLPTLD
jgi:hypothetical protein